MSDFRPVQLDALEDALEDLELGIPPEAGGPEVAHRLDEYREILQWTRDAMPLLEVTPGLLDGVLEEARSVAPVVIPTANQTAEPASWWKKLRGVFVIPVLAVAASAALVLILVRPMAEENAADTTLARSEPAPAEVRAQAGEAKTADGQQPAGALENGLADASLDQEQTRGRLRLSEEEGVDRAAAAMEPAEAAPADEPARAADAKPVVEEEPPPPPASMPKQSKGKAKPSEKIFYDDGGGSEKSGGAPGGGSTTKKDAAKESPAPPPKPATSSSDATKQEEQKNQDFDDDAWGSIATADKERRAGDCASANKRYKTLSTAVDRRVKARALAGLGLCATNEKSANDFFGKARKVDPDIAGFIAHERGGPPQADADQAESL
jgi:hypothetical protein